MFSRKIHADASLVVFHVSNTFYDTSIFEALIPIFCLDILSIFASE